MNKVAARLRDLAVLFIVPLFFSANVVIGRGVAAEVGPWTLAFLRWALAFLILLPFAVTGLQRNMAAIRAEAGIISALGFLGMFVCGGVVFLGLHYTTATNATLIYASANVLILLLEWRFCGRTIGLREIVGTLLAFAGVAVVTFGAGETTGFALNRGDLMIGLAALAWAIYSVLLKRPEVVAIPGLALFAAIMIAGIATLTPMAAYELTQGTALPETARAWLGVFAVALIPSVGAYSGYQYGIRRFGPVTMAMTSYLWTPYGILLAVIFLGESFRLHHAIGLALILPGVVLATARLPGRA